MSGKAIMTAAIALALALAGCKSDEPEQPEQPKSPRSPAPGQPGGARATVDRLTLLVHVLSAELIFILIPFTKIAHCVLMPLSQFISNLAWKFPANTDEDVCTTLNKKGAPV